MAHMYRVTITTADDVVTQTFDRDVPLSLFLESVPNGLAHHDRAEMTIHIIKEKIQ